MSETQGIPDRIQPGAFATRRATVAGSIGNVLEWYDFTVYAFFAGTIGRLFFPQSSEIDSLIASGKCAATVMVMSIDLPI